MLFVKIGLKSLPDSEVCPSSFSVIRRDRNRHGGGIAAFISSRVRYVSRPDLSCGNIESLWLELFPGSHKRSMLICCTYRPPSAGVSFF